MTRGIVISRIDGDIVDFQISGGPEGQERRNRGDMSQNLRNSRGQGKCPTNHSRVRGDAEKSVQGQSRTPQASAPRVAKGHGGDTIAASASPTAAAKYRRSGTCGRERSRVMRPSFSIPPFFRNYRISLWYCCTHTERDSNCRMVHSVHRTNAPHTHTHTQTQYKHSRYPGITVSKILSRLPVPIAPVQTGD